MDRPSLDEDRPCPDVAGQRCPDHAVAHQAPSGDRRPAWTLAEWASRPRLRGHVVGWLAAGGGAHRGPPPGDGLAAGPAADHGRSPASRCPSHHGPHRGRFRRADHGRLDLATPTRPRPSASRLQWVLPTGPARALARAPSGRAALPSATFPQTLHDLLLCSRSSERHPCTAQGVGLGTLPHQGWWVFTCGRIETSWCGVEPLQLSAVQPRREQWRTGRAPR